MFDFVFGLTPIEIYIMMSILMFTNGLFLFPSSQAILIVSGILTMTNNVNLILLFSLLIIFNVLGNYVLFYIAYYWGEEVARKILPIKKRKLDEDILLTKYLFEKYGNYIILIGRNLPVLHSLISLPAGVAKTPHKTFLTFTIIGVLIWSFIFFGIGVFFGNDYENLFGLLNMILLAITVIITFYVFYYFLRFKKKILAQAKTNQKI